MYLCNNGVYIHDIYMFIHMYMYMYIRTYMYIHADVNMYILYTYMYMYMYIIHTHVHKQVLTASSPQWYTGTGDQGRPSGLHSSLHC